MMLLVEVVFALFFSVISPSFFFPNPNSLRLPLSKRLEWLLVSSAGAVSLKRGAADGVKLWF
jgi:hypothetical protein